MSVLNSTIAGSWYPGNAAALRRLLDDCAVAAPPSAAPPNLLILPHAGYDYSAATAMYGIARIMGAPFRRVVVLAPSHRRSFSDCLIAPSSDGLATPFGEIPVDTAALAHLSAAFPVIRDDAVHAAEHAAQIEYPLLQYALKDFQLLPLLVSDLSQAGMRRAAAALRGIVDADTLLVVSSDFIHYGRRFGFTPFAEAHAQDEAQKLNREAFAAIAAGDAAAFQALVTRTGATICGLTPILLMLHTVPPGARWELLHDDDSVGVTSDAADFVCYLAAAGYSGPGMAPCGEVLNADEKARLLAVARRSIEYALATRHAPDPETFAADATAAMRKPMGCFVTLHCRKTGHLRGCIGEIEPQRALYCAVSGRAIDAAFRDPRFEPLTAAEWPDIRLEISALTPSRPVADWREIVIGKHGMTLRKRGRMAVFLPQVATEQHWDREATLTHLALKAGLGPEDWREGAEFTVFEAIVFGEA